MHLPDGQREAQEGGFSAPQHKAAERRGSPSPADTLGLRACALGLTARRGPRIPGPRKKPLALQEGGAQGGVCALEGKVPVSLCQDSPPFYEEWNVPTP